MEDLNRFTGLEDKPCIIIPAHNEENNIGNLLREITSFKHMPYTVIVACNSCSDRTVEIVKSFSDRVICIEIDDASKIKALNSAESLNLGYPRVYVDADVLIDSDSVMALINELNTHVDPCIAVPKPNIDTDKSSTLVKIYYKVWLNTKHCLVDGYGGCVFALNKSARSCFDEFPDIICDDGFVRHMTPNMNVSIVSNSISFVKPPKTIQGLLKIKTRSKLGNYQLESLGLNSYSSKDLPGSKHIYKSNYLYYFVYYAVNFIAMMMAKYRGFKIDSYVWQRDDSSRN